MNPVFAAFPRRPLRLRLGRGPLGAWILAVFGILFFGSIVGLMTFEIGPTLRDDFAMRDTALPTGAVRMTDGKCRSRLFLLQSCEVQLHWRTKDGERTRKVSYMFVEPHLGTWSLTAMSDPGNPDRVTTDMGLDRLWNRLITAVAMVAFVLAIMVGLLIAALKAQRDRRRLKALDGRPLQPVAVRFGGWGNPPAWTVQDEKGESFTWPVRKSDKPFVLDAQHGLVLALRDPQGGPAFPLDEKLRFVRLSKEEKAQILAARPA